MACYQRKKYENIERKKKIGGKIQTRNSKYPSHKTPSNAVQRTKHLIEELHYIKKMLLNHSYIEQTLSEITKLQNFH